MDNRTMTFLAQQLVWLGISFVISISLALIFPFYISLPLTVAIFIGMAFYFRKRILEGKKIPMMNFGKTMSSKADFYCISCGHKHSKRECPRCGSRQKKMGF